MLKRTLLAAAAVAAVTGATQASADPMQALRQTLSCTDNQGRRVMTLINPSIGTAAMLIRTHQGYPVIVLNGGMLKRLGEPTLVFAFYRMCAHFKLRHPERRNSRHETRADCWAIQHMARRGMLNVKRARQIIKSIYRYTGEARGKYVLSCARRYAKLITRNG